MVFSCLETHHSVLWVRLFMGHLQQLLRCAHTHLAEHVKPATAQKDKQWIRIRSDTEKKCVDVFCSSPPCILGRLGKHLIGSLICDNVQRVLFLMVIHNLPAKKQTVHTSR